MARKIIEKFEPKNIVLGITFNRKNQLLITLNKHKDGTSEWMLLGGKIDDLTPENALINEFKEEIDRKIKISGRLGSITHKDARGILHATLYRLSIEGDLNTGSFHIHYGNSPLCAILVGYRI